MDKKQIVIGIGTVAALAYLLNKKSSASDDLVIQVYDEDGNLIPANSPVSLLEGNTYTVRVTVRNSSTWIVTGKQ